VSTAAASVAILLSTFNGARFLPAQLNSLLSQSHENWVLHWRDDGSQDETVALMRGFAERIGAERCVESPSSGRHMGVCESFLLLLREAPPADAVAFADQDDVWLPEKLDNAVRMIHAAGEGPVLYSARQYLVDEELRGAKPSTDYSPVPVFPACLTQNIANGNTLVMNAAAAALVAGTGAPQDTVHDWWSYIVVSACGGTVLFDERPQVLYRLHKQNLIGRAQPLPARAIAALRRGSDIYMTMMRRHADLLATLGSRLTPQARTDLRLIQAALEGGWPERIAALRCARFRRRTLLENLLFAFWFLKDEPHRTPAALPAWSGARATRKA